MWQAFRVTPQFVWVEVLVLVVWVLQVLGSLFKSGGGCVAAKLSAVVGALIRSGGCVSFGATGLKQGFDADDTGGDRGGAGDTDPANRRDVRRC